MAYESQVLTAKNQTSWANKVPQGGVIWDSKTKSYYFRDPTSGKVQYTSDLNTAYKAAGVKAGETPGTAVFAQNQAYKLGGAQIQYDSKSKSYYFKDPVSGKILTTPDLATAYGILYPTTSTTTSDGVSYDPKTTPVLKDTGEQVSLVNTSGTGTNTIVGTPESGFRPTATSPQFFQPVYQPTYQNYAREGYSLMGDQSGLGALQAVLGQNTAGNAALDLSAFRPRGIGQTANPFALNPNNFRAAYQTAMSQAQPNYGQFTGLGQLASPFTGGAQQTAYAQPSTYGTMGGIGSLSSPFGAAGSQGAFGGGFGGTSLYSRGR